MFPPLLQPCNSFLRQYIHFSCFIRNKLFMLLSKGNTFSSTIDSTVTIFLKYSISSIFTFVLFIFSCVHDLSHQCERCSFFSYLKTNSKTAELTADPASPSALYKNLVFSLQQHSLQHFTSLIYCNASFHITP